MRFIEVSHTIEPGMKTYPGLPEPRAEILIDHDSSRARYQEKSEFLIASLHLCGNTGTYVDSPLHRYRNAVDLAGLPLERLAHLRTVVVEAPGSLERGITAAVFRSVEVRDNAVLITFGDISPLLPALAVALITVSVNFVVDWVLHASSGLKEC